MKNEDVKIGMKVVPHSKTVRGWSGLNSSKVWRAALYYEQPYLFVIGYKDEEECWDLSLEKDSDSGDFFNAEDFEPYEENKMTPETKYLVVSVRKSDGQTFFPENANHRKGIDDLQVAVDIATEKARKNSTDYAYVVYRCEPVASIELDDKPVKVTVY